MDLLPLHRSIIAVDIEGSTSPLRTDPIRGDLRRAVHAMLCAALERAGVGPARCEPFEDRGDGALVLVRPSDEVPKTYLLSRFVPELHRLLAEYDRALPAEEWPSRGLRLRAVVHAGEVHRDEFGYFGEALDVACRLLDARQLKRRLRCAAGPLAVVVSDEIYRCVVRHGYEGIPCDGYLPDVRVLVGGRRRQGWVHVPEARALEAAPVLRAVPAGPPAA
ncbi:hypothetical protein [Actinomadura parmotrematis]|uniref:Guanylate cyclase domain-containing protein n=1 Tax=Actinomadura parmotrematis TaxID=2864039 RepID=A0ABS7G6D2_9ACTN|nr:hypothetical protein [Actinomadura parmotrematis]MBW8487434.1 hypothetical protein [Actinomadura parmotrematis]